LLHAHLDGIVCLIIFEIEKLSPKAQQVIVCYWKCLLVKFI